MSLQLQPVDSSARLVTIVQELSLARSLERIVDIVRAAARELTGADGASFVLREHCAQGDVCFYVDEDAIAPLWKGRRFPASICVSGWVMRHRCAAVIEDVMADPRVPADIYAPTFVKSLVMVPIRSAAPIGAIGTYWAVRRAPTAREVQLLQALADSTSIAMENVEVYADLEARVVARTAELGAASADLARENAALVALAKQKEELSALVVHDIKGPANALMLRAEQRRRTAETDAERRAWTCIYLNGESVARFADNLLDIAQAEDCSFKLVREAVRVPSLIDDVVCLMQPLVEARGQAMKTSSTSDAVVCADCEVLRRVLRNLVENAVVHNTGSGTITIDAREEDGTVVISVGDEGPGIPPAARECIFDKYARVKCAGSPRTGRGLGLAFCRLAVEAHGGRISVEDGHPRGCCFCVRLPVPRQGLPGVAASP
jgi:signal transduction histidine kinase